MLVPPFDTWLSITIPLVPPRALGDVTQLDVGAPVQVGVVSEAVIDDRWIPGELDDHTLAHYTHLDGGAPVQVGVVSEAVIVELSRNPSVVDPTPKNNRSVAPL